MSEHEVITLEANFQNWKRERFVGLGKIEPFLYYSVDHITKQFNLTDEQVLYGITDHINDGGIDAIYCLAGKGSILLRDDSQARIGGSDLMRILIFQVKSSLSETGFKPSDIDSFTNFTDDLLHLEKSSKELKHKYQPHLLTIMQVFKDKYLEMAARSFPRVVLQYYYVTRGDEEVVNPTAQDAINRLRAVVVKHRGSRDQNNFEFFPVNTQVLFEFVRNRRQRSHPLKWKGQPIPLGDAFVGLVRLTDYFNFLKDEKGLLDELIFESNVRDNQGKTSVNLQMRQALDKGGPPDFASSGEFVGSSRGYGLV